MTEEYENLGSRAHKCCDGQEQMFVLFQITSASPCKLDNMSPHSISQKSRGRELISFVRVLIILFLIPTGLIVIYLYAQEDHHRRGNCHAATH